MKDDDEQDTGYRQVIKARQAARRAASPTAVKFTDPFYVRVSYFHEIYGKSKYEVEKGVAPYPASPRLPAGIPATIKLTDGSGKATTPFPQAWQEYIFELIKMRVAETNPTAPPASVDYVARGIFAFAYTGDRFQNNKMSSAEGYYDFINREGKDQRNPIKLEPIITSGNIRMVIGDMQRKAGTLCYPVKTFNVADIPPDPLKVNWRTRPDLVMLASIETRIPKPGNKGDRICRSFEPRNKQRAGITQPTTDMIPYIVLCNGVDYAWLPAFFARMVTEEQVKRNNVFD